MKKRLRHITLFLGVAIATMIAAAVVLAAMYEDEISRFALTELESKLVSDMHIEDINLSLLADFPNASLRCSNVLIMDTFSPSDTLLFAENISLEFSVLDLLDENYVVNEITIKSATGRLLRSADDNVNYIFWSQDSSTTSPSVFSFGLEKVTISDSRLQWQDELSEVMLDFSISTALLKGNFQDDKISLSAELDLADALVDVSAIPWLNHAAVEGEVEVEIDTSERLYAIKEANLEVEGMKLTSTGRFQQTDEVVFCVLKTDAQDIKLPTLLKILPHHTTAFLNGYEVSGKADVQLDLQGAAGGGQAPEIKLQAQLQSAGIKQIASNVAVTDIQSIIDYRYKDSDELTIQSCSAELEGNKIELNGAIAHLQSPWMNVHLSGELNLNDLKEFVALDHLETCEGLAEFEINYKGAMRNWEFNSTDINRAESSGVCTLQNGEFKWAGSRHSFEQVNGAFSLINGDATIQHLKGISGSSDFAFQGAFKNLLSSILADEKLRIEASFSAEKLDLTDWLTDTDATTPEESSPYHLEFPSWLEFELEVQTNRLVFRKFKASDVKGLAKLNSGQLQLDPVSFSTADGQFKGNLVATATPNGFQISSNAWLDNMDVNALFTEFEDFGQDFIQAHHIRGKCSAKATFSTHISAALEVDPNSIVSVIDLQIDNGELIGLQSMNSICNYLRTNKVVAPFVDVDALEDRLQHIAFNTLENQIDIRDNRIHFPNMEIHSSAMDITTSGTHFFDNQIDYSIGFYLRDLLVQKNETEFGEVEDDGLGNRFFIAMTGSVDNPEFGYDRLAHKAQRKQDREAEKQAFKLLLKEEFGLFKKDKQASEPQNEHSSPNGTPETTIEVTLPTDQKQDEPEKGGLKKLFGKKTEEKEELPPPSDDDDF